MNDLNFQIYKPKNLELINFYNPIEMEPIESNNKINSIIEKAKLETPDLNNIILKLTPDKNDLDLKRIMQPLIDELLEETKIKLNELKIK